MAKSRVSKVKFFGHEIVLTFVGSLIIALGAMLAQTDFGSPWLTLFLAAVTIWLGMLVFLYPIVRKIENLM